MRYRIGVFLSVCFFFFPLWGGEVLYTIPPSDFSAKMVVAGCFCKKEDKFLLLLRRADGTCGNTWCLPAKKIGFKESPIKTAVQELKQEIGAHFVQDDLTLFKKFYIRLPDKDFELYLFEVNWDSKQVVVLSGREHTAFLWTTLEEALKLPLIPGAEIYLKLLFEKNSTP